MGVSGVTMLLGSMMLAAAAGGGSRPDAPSPDESIEVKVRGTLNAGMMAIGGETTGFTIRARGVTWELDFGSDAALRSKATALDGKSVLVTGSLEVRPGVEIASRSIVKVASLAPAGGEGSPASKSK
jgi:hypothetical protein